MHANWFSAERPSVLRVSLWVSSMSKTLRKSSHRATESLLDGIHLDGSVVSADSTLLYWYLAILLRDDIVYGHQDELCNLELLRVEMNPCIWRCLWKFTLSIESFCEFFIEWSSLHRRTTQYRLSGTFLIMLRPWAHPHSLIHWTSSRWDSRWKLGKWWNK